MEMKKGEEGSERPGKNKVTSKGIGDKKGTEMSEKMPWIKKDGDGKKKAQERKLMSSNDEKRKVKGVGGGNPLEGMGSKQFGGGKPWVKKGTSKETDKEKKQHASDKEKQGKTDAKVQREVKKEG